ncbi:hypothetical protein C9J85_18960 [Haloferax sp. wsp5]|nr:hypothetical protein C9J85_18960 [Haloferax sp. wsp5]
MTARFPSGYGPATPPASVAISVRRAGAGREYIEIPGCRADGTEVPLGVSFSEYEFQGEQCFAGIGDISEREESERELESFQRAIEQAADGVAILADGEYEYVDQTHVDMYGFDEETSCSASRGGHCTTTRRRPASKRCPPRSKPTASGKASGDSPARRRRSRFGLSLTIIDDGRLVCTVRRD